jgi:hypothetical protein
MRRLTLLSSFEIAQNGCGASMPHRLKGAGRTVCALLAVSIFGAASAWAQLSAPVLGYIPDGAKLRPVYGIPAAAAVMPVLDSGRELGRAAVSPRQDYVLASAADSGEVGIVRPGQSFRSLTGAYVSPDLIGISPNGSAAALYFSSSHHFQIVKGLPDSPEIREVDATFLGDAPVALAIADDAQWLVGAWALGVHAFGPHGDVNRLPLDDAATALAFFHASHDLAVGTAQGVYTIADVGGRNLVGRLTATADAAMFAAVTLNNRRTILASASGMITAVDLDTGATSTADCACTPEGLFPMGRNAFRLNSLGFGAFKLFDADTGDVLFAPVTAEEGARQ